MDQIAITSRISKFKDVLEHFGVLLEKVIEYISEYNHHESELFNEKIRYFIAFLAGNIIKHYLGEANRMHKDLLEDTKSKLAAECWNCLIEN